MNNNKVIFIDYDGTLYSRKNNKIYEEVYELLEKCKKNNIDVFLSTGRTMLYLQNDSRLLSLLKGVVGANGTFVKLEDKYLYNNFINKEEVYKFFDYTKEHDLSITCFGKDKAYVRFLDMNQYEGFKYYNPMKMVEINNKEEIIDDIELICLYAPYEQIKPAIPLFPNLQIYKWGASGADVIVKGPSKGSAIKEVIKYFDYSIDNTYGIGDGINDIEMFKTVKYSIAMGNASDEIKAHALKITDSLDNRGVEKVLLEILDGKM